MANEFPLPTLEQVLAEVNLKPEQVNRSLTQNAFEADVQGRIASQAVVVDARIGALYSYEQLGMMSTTAIRAVTECYKLRAAMSVLDVAGQLNEAYAVEARNFERRAEEALQAAFANLNRALAAAAPVVPDANTPASPPRSRLLPTVTRV